MELCKTIMMVAGAVYLGLIGLTLFGLLVAVLRTWARAFSEVLNLSRDWKKGGADENE